MGKISRKIFLISAFFTVMVFIAGITVGWLLDRNRVFILENELNEFRINFESLRIQESIFETLNQSACVTYYDRFLSLAERTDDLSERFNRFDAITQFQKERIETLKKTYTLTNLDLWLQTVNLKNKCNFNFTTILFFYSLQDCIDCDAQGLILSQLKSDRPNEIMIFAIDFDLNLDVIKVLRENFELTIAPAIVINENEIYQRLLSKEELKQKLGF